MRSDSSSGDSDKTELALRVNPVKTKVNSDSNREITSLDSTRDDTSTPSEVNDIELTPP